MSGEQMLPTGTGGGEAWDVYDMVEWFAAQPWCDGNVGMFGCSQVGETQLKAAGTMPPHLKAMLPFACSPEKYDAWWGRGGIRQARRPDRPWTADLIAVPVDGDTDEDGDGYPDMLYEAAQEHQFNVPLKDIIEEMPYRDSYSESADSKFWAELSAMTYCDQINNSGIAMYHYVTWNDESATWAAPVSFVNFKVPSKLTIGGWWGHCGTGTFDSIAEHLRFFDYWLKGIDNGIMDEPPIYYYALGAPAGEEWRFAWQWPLPNEQPTKYYLHAGPSGIGSGVNDGILSTTPPTEVMGQDDYEVYYGLTEENMDEEALTYTTAPLASDVELMGYPVVHLWISSTATDGDFFAYFEDIAPDGSSTVLGYGRLRASHRALHTPYYDTLGRPWHRSYEEDIAPLTPGEPVELAFDLSPTSCLFKAGHRMRLTIACDYARGLWVYGPYGLMTLPELDPPPNVSVYRNVVLSSYVTLPVTTEPITAVVQIEPEALNLNSKGKFTAVISFSETLTQGYIDDVDISTVMCNGASAVSGKVANRILVMQFNTEDLNVTPGEKVDLTVTGEFGDEFYYGPLTFEGSDTIRVLDE